MAQSSAILERRREERLQLQSLQQAAAHRAMMAASDQAAQRQQNEGFEAQILVLENEVLGSGPPSSLSARVGDLESIAIDHDNRLDALELGGGGGTGLALQTVEVNLGNRARRAGRFIVAGVGMTIGKPVLIQQASGPYTGKGSRADEAEMDHVSVSAKVISATVIEAYWNSSGPVRGNRKFDYQVSA